MAGIGEAASIIAVVQITAQISKLCSGYLSEVKNAPKDVERLQSKISSLHSVLEKIEQMLRGSKSARLTMSTSVLESLKRCVADLEELKAKLDTGKRKKAMSRVGLRSLKWPFTRKEVEKAVEMLEGYTTTFNVALLADNIFISLGIDDKLDQTKLDHLLAKVHCLEEAAFKSDQQQHERQCLPETRVDLLRRVTEWADGTSSKCIFWLNGMAGTGKSTIARTVANHFSNRNRLGASFFFSKGSGDRGRAKYLFSTIAVQMTRALPVVRKYVSEAISKHPGIAQQTMSEQWNKLILEPLRTAIDHQLLSSPVIFIIDALDECDKLEDIGLTIRLLAGITGLVTAKLRVFVTSRPETPIRLGFRDMPRIQYEDLALHDVSRHIVEADIYIFLKNELGEIRRKRKISTDWPSDHELNLLVQKSNCLFIYAATACRYISDPKFLPKTRLFKLIFGEVTDGLPTRNLDKIYLEILTESVTGDHSDSDKKELEDRFHRVVGSIVVLFDALSATALSQLLTEELDMVNITLDPLHSVLSVPQDTQYPISLLHPSFRDFLLARDRCSDSRFLVDQKLAHSRLAKNCLELMSIALKENICGLQSPGPLASDMDQLVCYIPSPLQYACRYWVEHLQQGDLGLFDNGEILSFLQEHLLHWLEVLSIIRKSSEGLGMLSNLELYANSLKDDTLSTFVHDAKRFYMRYSWILERAPLQIYSSAIIFSPKVSKIRKQFLKRIPIWISALPEVEEQWGACQQVLEGHSRSVHSVVFSPDGQLVASGSHDGTVRLWYAATGEPRGVLKGHSDWVTSVVFSSDGQLVASGSDDGTVRLWDAATGEPHGVLEGHSDWVRSVVFSPDGELVASGSDDGTVRLWDPATGEPCGVLKGHSGWVRSVVFAPDGQLVASGSGDGTVRLWDAVTGEPHGVLKGHSGWVRSVVFSPDGQLVASGSHDGTVRLWDAATGKPRGVLKGHSDWVRSVVFSPDGQLVASGSDDSTVRLWDPATGEPHGVLEGHSGWVNTVVFSPDEQLVASGSSDSTVRLWYAATGEPCGVLEGHSNWVKSVVFSPDGQLVASGSDDGTVRLWGAATGEPRGVLEGHSCPVWLVVFSPDGQLVASGSGDRTVRLWNVNVKESISVIERRPYDQLSFNSSSSRLHVGAKEVDTGLLTLSTLPSQSGQSLSLDVTRHWVSSATSNILWLPPDCRPGVFAVRENRFIIGAASGRMVFLSFKVDGGANL